MNVWFGPHPYLDGHIAAEFSVTWAVIVGTAYKVLSNYTNHVADTPLDKGFAKNAWSVDAQSVG